MDESAPAQRARERAGEQRPMFGPEAHSALSVSVPIYGGGQRWRCYVLRHATHGEEIDTEQAIEEVAVAFGANAGTARRRADIIAEALA